MEALKTQRARDVDEITAGVKKMAELDGHLKLLEGQVAAAGEDAAALGKRYALLAEEKAAADRAGEALTEELAEAKAAALRAATAAAEQLRQRDLEALALQVRAPAGDSPGGALTALTPHCLSAGASQAQLDEARDAVDALQKALGGAEARLQEGSAASAQRVAQLEAAVGAAQGRVEAAAARARDAEAALVQVGSCVGLPDTSGH